jgi:glycosyltransferase involved in cell wall biosynthesis
LNSKEHYDPLPEGIRLGALKKVSIVIPAINEEKLLPSTLESVKTQTYRNLEVIVKDGLSDDKTVDIAKKYGAKAVSLKDSSAGEARNQGAQHASGDILVFLDADTLMARDTVRKLVEDFKKYNALLVFPRYLTREEADEVESKPPYVVRVFVKSWFTFEDLFRKYADRYAGGMCMACDAVAFRKIGGFNEELKVCEDIEISYRLKRIGPVICDHDIVVYPSARRYLKGGVLRSLLTYLVFRVRWHLGLEQPKPTVFR